ncbi:MAG: Flp family type IVb pilin [Pseudomonadota bacterium]
MRSTLKGLFGRFARNESGATLVEYGIAVVLAVIVGTGGLIVMAQQVDNNMDASQQAMVPNVTGTGIVDQAGS